jgi:hypothetical protein
MTFSEKDVEMIDEFYDAIDTVETGEEVGIHIESLGKRKAYIGYITSIKKLFDRNKSITSRVSSLEDEVSSLEDEMKYTKNIMNGMFMLGFVRLILDYWF